MATKQPLQDCCCPRHICQGRGVGMRHCANGTCHHNSTSDWAHRDTNASRHVHHVHLGHQATRAIFLDAKNNLDSTFALSPLTTKNIQNIWHHDVRCTPLRDDVLHNHLALLYQTAVIYQRHNVQSTILTGYTPINMIACYLPSPISTPTYTFLSTVIWMIGSVEWRMKDPQRFIRCCRCHFFWIAFWNSKNHRLPWHWMRSYNPSLGIAVASRYWTMETQQSSS